MVGSFHDRTKRFIKRSVNWPELTLPPINLWTVWSKAMKERRLNDATPAEWDEVYRKHRDSRKKTRSEILKKIKEVDEQARKHK